MIQLFIWSILMCGTSRISYSSQSSSWVEFDCRPRLCRSIYSRSTSWAPVSLHSQEPHLLLKRPYPRLVYSRKCSRSWLSWIVWWTWFVSTLEYSNSESVNALVVLEPALKVLFLFICFELFLRFTTGPDLLSWLTLSTVLFDPWAPEPERSVSLDSDCWKPLFRLDVRDSRSRNSHDVSKIFLCTWGICVWWRGFLWCDEWSSFVWKVSPRISFVCVSVFVWVKDDSSVMFTNQESLWCMLEIVIHRRGRTVGELSRCSVSSQSHQKIRWNARSRETYFFCVDRILSACSSSHYLFAFSLSLIFGVYAAAAVREEDDEKSSKSERRMMSSLCLLSEAST